MISSAEDAAIVRAVSRWARHDGLNNSRKLMGNKMYFTKNHLPYGNFLPGSGIVDKHLVPCFPLFFSMVIFQFPN